MIHAAGNHRFEIPGLLLPVIRGTVLAMLLGLLIWFGLPAPTAAAEPVADGGVEVRVLGRLPLRLNPDERREFEQKTLKLAEITRRQDGVTSYSCNSDIEHPGVYIFDEVWPSEAVLKSHLQTEHFQAWWQWVEPHLNGELVIGVSPMESFHAI